MMKHLQLEPLQTIREEIHRKVINIPLLVLLLKYKGLRIYYESLICTGDDSR